MGNAVISGILFQPPSPPNALDYRGPDESDGDRRQNLSVNYLWINSPNERGECCSPIPAVHITHGNPCPDSTQRYTLLYSHGNAEDLGLIASFLTDLARLLNINVLCYDYSGYGVSSDEAYVAEYYAAFGSDLERWRAWREGLGATACGTKSEWGELSSGSGYRARYSREVFVSPLIHPRSSACNDEDDGGGADDAYAFTNTCNWTKDNPGQESPLANLDGSGRSLGSSTRLGRRAVLSRFGWTPPSSSESGCYANIAAAYDYLTTVECIPPNHVILYGKSVGSGPTCWLAQKLCAAGRDGPGGDERSCIENPHESCGTVTDEFCNVESREPSQAEGRSLLDEDAGGGGGGSGGVAPGGIVLHSPFLSVIRVVLDVGFTTIGDLFPNVDRVGDFTCPVYVIHGSNDAIVPFYHGQSLFQALPDKSKTVPFWARGAGHNNIEMDMPTAYIKRLQQFVRQIDRMNYPTQASQKKLLQASLQASLKQSMQQIGGGLRGGGGGRPGIARYASQDSYHNSSMMMSSNRPSKQRKQKGTLVMRSSHNHGQAAVAAALPPPPPPPPAPVPSHHCGSSVQIPVTIQAQHGAVNQQMMYASASPSNHARYHRSMSTGMLNIAPPSPHLSPSMKYQQMQQQLYLQQQQQQQTSASRGNNGIALAVQR